MSTTTTETRKVNGSFTKAQIDYLNKIDKQNKTDTLKLNQDMGQEQFLNILLTQLANQNPLDPMQDKDFIAQMAQFSSVESMQALNDTFDVVKADIAAIKKTISGYANSDKTSQESELLEKINKSLEQIQALQLKQLNKQIGEKKTQTAYEWGD